MAGWYGLSHFMRPFTVNIYTLFMTLLAACGKNDNALCTLVGWFGV